MRTGQYLFFCLCFSPVDNDLCCIAIYAILHFSGIFNFNEDFYHLVPPFAPNQLVLHVTERVLLALFSLTDDFLTWVFLPRCCSNGLLITAFLLMYTWDLSTFKMLNKTHKIFSHLTQRWMVNLQALSSALLVMSHSLPSIGNSLRYKWAFIFAQFIGYLNHPL